MHAVYVLPHGAFGSYMSNLYVPHLCVSNLQNFLESQIIPFQLIFDNCGGLAIVHFLHLWDLLRRTFWNFSFRHLVFKHFKTCALGQCSGSPKCFEASCNRGLMFFLEAGTCALEHSGSDKHTGDDCPARQHRYNNVFGSYLVLSSGDQPIVLPLGVLAVTSHSLIYLCNSCSVAQYHVSSYM